MYLCKIIFKYYIICSEVNLMRHKSLWIFLMFRYCRMEPRKGKTFLIIGFFSPILETASFFEMGVGRPHLQS